MLPIGKEEKGIQLTPDCSRLHNLEGQKEVQVGGFY